MCGARPGGRQGLHGRRWGRRPPAPGQLHPRTAVLERDTWGYGGTGRRDRRTSLALNSPEICSGRRVRVILLLLGKVSRFESWCPHRGRMSSPPPRLLRSTAAGRRLRPWSGDGTCQVVPDQSRSVGPTQLGYLLFPCRHGRTGLPRGRPDVSCGRLLERSPSGGRPPDCNLAAPACAHGVFRVATPLSD